jgi:hypothetical protein
MEPRKREDEEEEEAFLPQPSEDGVVPDSRSNTPERSGTKRKQVTGYLRILLEIFMAATIAYLVVFKPFIISRETIRRTPVPQCTWSNKPLLTRHA